MDPVWGTRSETNFMTAPLNNADFIEKFKNDPDFSGVDFAIRVLDGGLGPSSNISSNDGTGSDFDGTGRYWLFGTDWAIFFGDGTLASEIDVIPDATGSAGNLCL